MQETLYIRGELLACQFCKIMLGIFQNDDILLSSTSLCNVFIVNVAYIKKYLIILTCVFLTSFPDLRSGIFHVHLPFISLYCKICLLSLLTILLFMFRCLLRFVCMCARCKVSNSSPPPPPRG